MIYKNGVIAVEKNHYLDLCPFNSMGSMFTILLFLQSLAIGDVLRTYYNILLWDYVYFLQI